jgi:hypothetical protein
VAVTPDKPAPYATSNSILEIIDRHRNRGLPSPVDAEVLARSGIPESLIPRTLQSLQTLDLIDEDGRPSQILEGIRLAPEAEFRRRLAEWLQAAYADVLLFVDPAKDDETAIRDAFRNYNPIGQQPRMITLFLGLMTAAGLAGDKEAQPRRSRPPTSQGTSKPAPQSPKVNSAKKDNDPPPPKTTLPLAISEKALEYRLVDLMSEAADDPEVLTAIIKVITFLKTKGVGNPPA